MRNWLDILKSEFYHPATVLWRAVELRHIEEFLNKYELPTPILDLGCAEGKIADALFKNKELIGLDNCWELLSQNKNRDIYKALILADGCRMPFKEGVFGSVFSNCVIEHIRDIDTLLSEVARALKEKNIFIFTVPSDKFADFLFFSRAFNKLGLKRLALWYGRKRNKQLNHFHCYSHNRWEQILKEKGLELIEYRYYMTEEATSAWDFLVGLIFIFNRLKIFKNIERNITFFFKRQLRKYYGINANEGAGLLIIATKI